MLNQIRDLSFPAVVLLSWVVAGAVCLGNLNDMSSAWAARRIDAQQGRAPIQETTPANPNPGSVPNT